MKQTLTKYVPRVYLVLAVSVVLLSLKAPAFSSENKYFGDSWHFAKYPGLQSWLSQLACRNDPTPTLDQLRALDRTDFMVLYPGIYTDYEKAAVEEYLSDNAALKTRGPVDVQALISGTLPEDTPGIGPAIEATEAWVRYQNDKYDPYNPIRYDSAYAQALGYDDILAYMSFGAHDDSLMVPWPTNVRDRLLVSDLNHSITAYKPIYPGDTLYIVADEREILDLTPEEGSTYRSIAIQTKGSLYNQDGELVCDLTFRVTEGLSIYADDSLRPEDPDFTEIWEAPDWLSRPSHYYTDNDWKFIKRVWARETLRGAEPLYWEDVSIGDRPTWTLEGPIYAGAQPTTPWGMGAGGSRTLKQEIMDPEIFATMVRSETDGIYYLPDPENQVPATPDAGDTDDTDDEDDTDDGAIDPDDIHDPGDYDRAVLINFIGRDFAIRHITNWMGDQGWIRHIGWSIMDPRAHAEYGKYVVSNPRAVHYLKKVPFMRCKYVNIHGLTKDIGLVKSYVTDKWVRDGKFEVELVWWIENIEGDIWEEGGAIVQLPSKYAD